MPQIPVYRVGCQAPNGLPVPACSHIDASLMADWHGNFAMSAAPWHAKHVEQRDHRERTGRTGQVLTVSPACPWIPAHTCMPTHLNCSDHWQHAALKTDSVEDLQCFVRHACSGHQQVR